MTVKNEQFLLPLNLQFFSEDLEDKKDETITPEGGEEKVTDNETKHEEDVKTFTQAEIDALVKKAKAQAVKKYSDYDDLKQKIQEIEDEKETKRKEELTEIDRIREDKQKAEDDKQALLDRLNKLEEERKQEKILGAFKDAAQANSIEYVAQAMKLADLSAVEIGEDGSVTGMDELVKALVEENPFLIKEKKQPKTIGEGSNQATKTDKTADQILEEAKNKAIKSGRIEDRLNFAKLKRELGK